MAEDNSTRRRGDRKADIAEAALRIIATRGVAALTTTAVAAELGLTSGALFRHFASREAILEEVAARVEEILAANIPPPELPPAERLERFIRQRASTAGGQAGVLRLLLSEQFTLALPETAVARLRRAIATTHAFLVQTIREGAADGSFRSDIAPEELVVIAMGTTQMLAFLHGVAPLASSEQRTDRAIGALRKLLAPAPGKRRSS